MFEIPTDMFVHVCTIYTLVILQIDPHTVKHLDRNLFLGEEIREVYQEIMRTVPTTHLELDDVS